MASSLRGPRVLVATMAAVTIGLAEPVVAQAHLELHPLATVAYGGRVSRAEVLRRARDWLRRDIPYSQDNGRARTDLDGGRSYRPDCSGFISMAWALDPRQTGVGRALTTWELPGVSTPVPWSALGPGDIFLRLANGDRSSQHVQLFESWIDAAHTRAAIIEESGRADGIRRRVVAMSTVRASYAPYRYRRIY